MTVMSGRKGDREMRAQELCERRGGRPGLYSLCGRKGTLNETDRPTETERHTKRDRLSKLVILRPANQCGYIRTRQTDRQRDRVSWCFTPCQPVQLYQGDR